MWKCGSVTSQVAMSDNVLMSFVSLSNWRSTNVNVKSNSAPMRSKKVSKVTESFYAEQ